MTTLNSFFREALNLPYQSNSQDNPLHEHQVRDLLDIHNISYIYQPNGPQDSPDFRVTLANGRVVDIECKSSKQSYPTYNGGLPKEGVVYIFGSNKYNETTIFFAEDIITERKRELYAQLVGDLNAVLKTYQMDDVWQEDERGFDFYVRNMYTQVGGKDKTDYFTHVDRNRCEQNVLNFNW